MNAQDNKIINGNCWVAYFDILGFSDVVKNLHVWFVRKEYEKALKEGRKYNVRCKFKFFSDSFIFYTDNDSQDSFRGIEVTSAIFFRSMFLHGIPMRGCLNTGRFYADEENGIFFGPAHIEAYRLAEGQNWIGFVLSEKTKKKLADFELIGFKSTYNCRYRKYKVPYNEEPKLRNLLAYNLRLIPNYNEDSARNVIKRLWIALGNMEYKAVLILRKKKGDKIINLKRCNDYKKIIAKYENTKKFMLHIYPELKRR